MIRIPNTELDHDETEEKVLDYYLGRPAETKDEWAQRVWLNCERAANGEDVASVYTADPDQTWQERAQELWENKKARRTEAIMHTLKVQRNELATIDRHPKYSKRADREAL